jgi:hypothetical protein
MILFFLTSGGVAAVRHSGAFLGSPEIDVEFCEQQSEVTR